MKNLNGFSDEFIDRIKNRDERNVRYPILRLDSPKTVVYWSTPFIQEGSKELQSKIHVDNIYNNCVKSEIRLAYMKDPF